MKNRIREIRKEEKITQSKLVEELSISRQYISKLERTEEEPLLKVANQIANALGVCIYKVFDLSGQEQYCCHRCENCN